MSTKEKKAGTRSRQKRKKETNVNIHGSNNAVATSPLSVAASIRIVLQNSRPVITFLLGVALIGGAIGSLYWWSLQPRVMTGDFNIAVAQFAPKGDANDIAPIVSQLIFSFLDGQYMLSSFQNVEVEHAKIGVISGADEARALAKKINAHLVIYGDVTQVNRQILITPQFYVVESHQADLGEVNGEHKLVAPITFLIKDLVQPSSKTLKTMQQKTSLLTEFTKALVYLAARKPSDLILAQDSIKKAIVAAEGYDSFPGEEVLYLFASDIARRQGQLGKAQEYLDEAVKLNEHYGRGYLAQANIYYDQGNYYLAEKLYKQAAELENKPLGAYILEKASIGLGNICFVQYQAVLQTEMDAAALASLANCALQNYQVVIHSYNEQSNPEDILGELTAGAYFSSGMIYQNNGQFESARLVYEQALKLTKDPEQKAQIQKALDEVRQQ